MTVVGIGVAGALGALARYGLEGAVSRRWPGAFPWGTFVVNVSGAFALGLVFVVLAEKVSVDPWLRSALTIGFLGAYTTFSTLSFESYRLIEDGAIGLALANTLGSLAAGLVAVSQGGRPRAHAGRGQAAADLRRRIRHVARPAALRGDHGARAGGGSRRCDAPG